MELFTENQKNHLKLPLYLEDNILHSHDCAMLKIILIEGGSGKLYINDKSMVLSAPALLCLNEKENFKVEKGEALITKVIYFLPSIVNSCLNTENIYWNPDCFSDTAKLDHFYFMPFLERNGSSIGQVNIGPITLRKISTGFDFLKTQLNNFDDNFWPCRSRSFLIEILFLVQHCYAKIELLNVDLPEAAASFNDIILYLHLNYSRKITIEEITKVFHTNRNTLNKRFTKETGLSVMEYIIKLRIKVACTLLRDTNLPISEIIERVGFTDNSYWGRTFKKLVGLTPTDYRKSQIINDNLII
jgi:AraC-like DNA-binding protein